MLLWSIGSQKGIEIRQKIYKAMDDKVTSQSLRECLDQEHTDNPL